MIRTDTNSSKMKHVTIPFPASILFKRIDELDSLDLDNIKIIEIIIKEIKYEVD
jgi:hypothetical protein